MSSPHITNKQLHSFHLVETLTERNVDYILSRFPETTTLTTQKMIGSGGQGSAFLTKDDQGVEWVVKLIDVLENYKFELDRQYGLKFPKNTQVSHQSEIQAHDDLYNDIYEKARNEVILCEKVRIMQNKYLMPIMFAGFDIFHIPESVDCERPIAVIVMPRRDVLAHMEHDKFTLGNMARLCTHVLVGLSALHGTVSYTDTEKYVHMDLKPDNVFFQEVINVEKSIKEEELLYFCIGDFGTTRNYSTGRSTRTAYLDDGFRAPELLNDGDGSYGIETDLYSVGILMLWWLLLSKDWSEKDILNVLKFRKSKGKDDNTFCKMYLNQLCDDDGFKKIILKATSYSPKDRYHKADDMLYKIEGSYTSYERKERSKSKRKMHLDLQTFTAWDYISDFLFEFIFCVLPQYPTTVSSVVQSIVFQLLMLSRNIYNIPIRLISLWPPSPDQAIETSTLSMFGITWIDALRLLFSFVIIGAFFDKFHYFNIKTEKKSCFLLSDLPHILLVIITNAAMMVFFSWGFQHF